MTTANRILDASALTDLGASLLPLSEVATFGDSRVAQGNNNDVMSGSDYASTYMEAIGFQAWVSYLSNQRVTFPRDLNFGVSGDTTADMLARVDAVAACRARYVVFFGSTNDRAAGWTADQTIANLEAITTRLLAAGKTLIFISEYPKGNSITTGFRLGTAALAYHFQVREWFNRAPLVYPGRAYAADCWDTVAVYDSAYGDGQTWATYLQTGNPNGVHQSPRGAYEIAKKLVPIFNGLIPATPPMLPYSVADKYDATDNPRGCLNANPVMSGTGGTVGSGLSGVVPDSYITARNSAAAAGTLTASFAVIDKAEGNGKWLEITVSGDTAANSTPEIYVYQNVLSKVSPGDVVETVGEVEIDAGSVGLLSAQLSTRNDTAPVRESRALDRFGKGDPYPDVALSGVQKTPPLIVGSGTTIVWPRLLLTFAESQTACSAVIRLGLFGCRKLA